MKTIFGSIFSGIIASCLVIALYHLTFNSKNPVLDYYVTENAVAVSPHDLRMEIDKGGSDFIIVDLRSTPEYAQEHIKGAINIPGMAGDKDAATQEARIVNEFKKLPKNKRIIIHCYTHYCMLAKHVGLMLAKQGIYVHELNVGWNEWRYQWDLWNGEGTSKTINISDYLEGSAVKKTGTSQLKNETGSALITPCSSDGLAGC